MIRSLRYVPLLLALALTACSTAVPPAEPLATMAIETADGTAFLPPIGADVDTSSFYPDAELVIEVHRLDGATVDPLLDPIASLADGSVSVEDGYYLALWSVRDTVRSAPDVYTVQVQAWATDLEPGSDLASGIGCIATDAVKGCLVGTFDASIRRSKRVKSPPGTIDLTRAQTLPIKVYIAGAANEPTSLSQIDRLAEPNEPFADVGPNCTVDEFSMPGQGLHALGSGLHALGSGLHALGSVGGLFLLEPGTETSAPGIRLFEPGEAGALASGLAGTDPFAQSAAILVVDDFGYDPNVFSPIFSLGADLTWPRPDMTVGDLGDLVAGNAFSHGALVMHQLAPMIEAAGFDTLVTPVEWPEFRVYYRSGDDPKQYLILAAVDTAGFDTDEIAERIQNALNGLRFYSELDSTDAVDIRQVAINMSFAIVPCSVLEDFEASGLATFEDYVAELGADNQVAADFYDELVELLITPLSSDTEPEPLLAQIESCSELILFSELTPQDVFAPFDPYEPSWPGDLSWRALVEYPEEFPEAEIPTWDCFVLGASVVYVASSGNFGLDYPMYPAAWPLVVGTSSQNAVEPGFDDDNKSSFSNSGEVMAPGALYELGRSSMDDPQRAIAYAGTSFSAPVVSLFTALDLMHSPAKCGLYNTSLLTYFDDSGNTALSDAVPPDCLP